MIALQGQGIRTHPCLFLKQACVSAVEKISNFITFAPESVNLGCYTPYYRPTINTPVLQSI